MHEENEGVVKEFLRDLSAKGCSKVVIRIAKSYYRNGDKYCYS